MKYKLGDLTVKNWNSWDRVPRDPSIVGAIILKGIGATTLATSAIATFVVGYIAVTAVTSWALRALAPKPSFGDAGSRGLLVNSREATAPQQIVYGEMRKGGIVTFIESTGDTNQYLHQVIVLAGHEVNSIGDIYINENKYEVNGSGYVTDQRYDEETEAFVADNKWGYDSGTSTSKIRIKKHTGADSQSADSDLVSETSVTSDFKGEGIAYIYVRMEYDQDVFAEGVPLFTAKVQGKKLYDPRTSTTVYSANAALCIRDYLVSAYGLDNSGDTNDAYFQTAANTCDEDVTLSGSGTENRYEINGVISLDQTPSDVLGDMMTACAGTLFWGQGEWHLKVGEYTSSIKTFTLDDLRGPITLDTKHSRRDNFNIVRGTFNDANQGFIRADYPEIRSSSFITDDNGVESALDLALPLTTSASMAQRLAKLTLFRGREQMTLSGDFGLEAFEVECGDIIALDMDRYGFSAKEFEVVGWKFRNDGDAGDLRVGLTLRETSSSAFSWSAEEAEITSNDSTVPSALDNITPSSLTITDTGVVQTDGSFVAQIKAAWTAGTNKFIDHHEVQWKLTSATDYAASQIAAGQDSIILGPFEAGEQYNVRVRAVLTTGRASPFVAATAHTVGGDTIAPSPITSLVATGGIESVILDWDAPTTQVGGGTLYDLKGYNVYRSTSNSQPGSPIAFVGADKYVDGALSESTSYYYWVSALDFSDNESTVVASGAVTTAATPQDGVDGVDGQDGAPGAPGADGTDGTNGTDGTDGADGAAGDTVVTGKVFYQTLQASSPSTPSATSYNVSTASFVGLSSGWSLNQPTVDITDTTVKEWASNFTVTIDGTTNAQTLVFTSPSGAIQVSDDIESDNYVAGSSGWQIQRDTGNAEFGAASIRGTLSASQIQIDNVTLDTNASDQLIIKQGGVNTNEITAEAISQVSESYTASGTVAYGFQPSTVLATTSMTGNSGDKFLGVVTVGWFSNMTSSGTAYINNSASLVSPNGSSFGITQLFHGPLVSGNKVGGMSFVGVFTLNSSGTAAFNYRPYQTNSSTSLPIANLIRVSLIRLKR